MPIELYSVLPNELPDAYMIFQKGSTYYAKSHVDGYDSKSGDECGAVINSVLQDMPNYCTIRCKGELSIDETIAFDSSLLASGDTTRVNFIFDKLLMTDDVDAILLKNLRFPIIIRGQEIRNPVDDNDKALIKLDTKVHYADIRVRMIVGDATDGKSIGVLLEGASTEGIMHNRIIIAGRPYALEKVLYVNLSSSSWASINKIDIGHCESQSPRQIHIYAAGSANISNNEITGVGGNFDAWNPQSLSPTYGIKLETAGSGVIMNTQFINYRIYSPNDEIYRADAGVYGTQFLGGMPRRDLTAWWHDAGVRTAFIDGWLPVSPYTRYTMPSNVYVSTATIVNGTSSIQVAHGLGYTPTIVVATGRHEETRDLICSARDATNLTISTGDGANVTADRIVDIYAQYNP